MSQNTLIFKAGIYFSYLANSLHIVCVLEMCWSKEVSSPTHNKQYDDDNSDVFNSFIDASKNKFHHVIDFSQGIDCVESMPGVLIKSLKKSGSGSCVVQVNLSIVIFVVGIYKRER